MKQHVMIVGALRIGFGVLLMLVASFLFALLFGIGWAVDDLVAFRILTLTGSIVGGFLLLVSIPGLVGGIGLVRFRPWAKILVLVVSALDLFNVPFGTVLGVYSFWVLTHEETAPLFESSENP